MINLINEAIIYKADASCRRPTHRRGEGSPKHLSPGGFGSWILGSRMPDPGCPAGSRSRSQILASRIPDPAQLPGRVPGYRKSRKSLKINARMYVFKEKGSARSQDPGCRIPTGPHPGSPRDPGSQIPPRSWVPDPELRSRFSTIFGVFFQLHFPHIFGVSLGYFLEVPAELCQELSAECPDGFCVSLQV